MLLVSKNSWFSFLHTFLPPCSLMKPFTQLAFIPPPLHLHLSTPGGSSSGWECTFSTMARASVIVPMHSFSWMCCRLIILNSGKHTVKVGRRKMFGFNQLLNNSNSMWHSKENNFSPCLLIHFMKYLPKQFTIWKLWLCINVTDNLLNCSHLLQLLGCHGPWNQVS